MEGAINRAQLYAKIEEGIRIAGSQAKFASIANCPPSEVSNCVNAYREPSTRILDAVGYRRVTVYVPVKARSA